jgi:hypothetical protein
MHRDATADREVAPRRIRSALNSRKNRVPSSSVMAIPLTDEQHRDAVLGHSSARARAFF